MNLQTTSTLNNGQKIPVLGFGTALISDDEGATVESVLRAIDAGYRHLDTAMIYYNERAVGKAVRQSGIPREEFFITTKVWTVDMRKERVAEAFEESLEKLGMDYVDMYMLHWPAPQKCVKAWLAMEKLVAGGRVKTAGVSNFTIAQLEDLLMISDLVPAVNQCEFHPRFQTPALHRFCEEKGIAFEAYKPLGQGSYVGDETVAAIGQKYDKSFAQVLLRWALQRGVIAIPKGSSEKHIRANADIFDFELDFDDMRTLNRMESGRSTGDCTPDCFDF